MTVASLPGPDKRQLKASSDIYLSFFIVLSNFFFKENAVSQTQAHRPTTTSQLPRSLFKSSQMR